MKSAPIFALALLLAGCAGQTPPTQTAQNAPKPTIVHFSHPDGRQFLEELAARCWLDRVLHGAAMLVGRESGRIIVTDDQTRLLTAEFVFSDAGQNKIALYGPAMETPQTRDLLLRTLENAAKSGETSCPETS